MTTIKPSAINATIAELLEPLASLPQVDEETNPFPQLSPKGAWVTASIHKYDQHWQPLDFLHNVRGTVMLLGRLIEIAEEGVVFSSNGDCVFCVIASTDIVGKGEIGQAVAHAFLRANGIEVSE